MSTQKFLVPHLKTVLIVDANPDIRDLIHYVLGFCYNTLEADNGEDGFCFFEQYQPELIIIDSQLCFISGLDLVKLIRNSSKQAKIIVSSGEQSTEMSIAGADLCLSKPLSMADLESAITTLLQ